MIYLPFLHLEGCLWGCRTNHTYSVVERNDSSFQTKYHQHLAFAYENHHLQRNKPLFCDSHQDIYHNQDLSLYN